VSIVERGLRVLLGPEAADLLLPTLPASREAEVEPIAPTSI
jgi:hypothetical protein